MAQLNICLFVLASIHQKQLLDHGFKMREENAEKKL